MTHGEQAARVAFASADLKGERTIPLTKQALAAIIDSAIELFKMTPVERKHDYTSLRCWCGEANHGATQASGGAEL